MDTAEVLEITEYCKVNKEIQETSVEDSLANSHHSHHSQEQRINLTKGRKIILVPLTHSHTSTTSTSIVMKSQQEDRSRASNKESKASIPMTIIVEPIVLSEGPSEELATEITSASVGMDENTDSLQLAPQRGNEHTSTKRTAPLQFKYCHTCGAPTKPYVERRIGPTNWALSALVCSLGCFMGCCLIPFFTEAAKDKVEVCSLCKNVFL